MAKGKIFIFVPHGLSRHYEDAGWEYVPGSDDCYSAKFLWVGKGTPVIPCNEETCAQAVREFDEVWPGGELDV